ncbi:hypothetical protein B2M20_17335 [Nitrobacter vulgaris]|uniref:Twin-arginine translocation signal domain-containing protein n=1 Tax=Nitrobacter vulgaris TaxID=29421 RepID=A0A1V4HU59_NITVU|nr:hypothetical protein B2M20_17335 [Nitrobacter vulgaris]
MLQMLYSRQASAARLAARHHRCLLPKRFTEEVVMATRRQFLQASLATASLATIAGAGDPAFAAKF